MFKVFLLKIAHAGTAKVHQAAHFYILAYFYAF